MSNNSKYSPCNSNDIAMSSTLAIKNLGNLHNWQLIENNKKISKNFTFKDFQETLNFVNKIGDIAENLGHHPDIYFTWGKCNIIIYTHKINGLHQNDFLLAEEIDKLLSC